MNAEKYLNNFDVNAIYKKILEKNKISSMEDNYSRHFTELKKKFQSLIPTLAKKKNNISMKCHLSMKIFY